jgi:hypothetical protein
VRIFFLYDGENILILSLSRRGGGVIPFLKPPRESIREGAIRARIGLIFPVFSSGTAKKGTLLHTFLKYAICSVFRQNRAFSFEI